MVHSQRERLLQAVAEVAAERGYAEMTITGIVARAGVSRRTFYEQFAEKETALLAAYDAAVEQLANVLLDALAESPQWRTGLRAAVGALLGFLAVEPAFTRLMFVEMAAAGQRARAHHRRTVQTFVRGLDALRPDGATTPPASTARVLVGGIEQTIADAVLEGRIAELPALEPDVMYLLVLPWFGEDEARLELAAPGQPSASSPKARSAKRTSASDT